MSRPGKAAGRRRRLFLRGVEEQMGRNTASQWVCSVNSSGARQRSSPHSRKEGDPPHRPSRGEMLILVLFLSLGLWALIWAGVSVLGAYGLR